jgi:hypothetical protein
VGSVGAGASSAVVAFFAAACAFFFAWMGYVSQFSKRMQTQGKRRNLIPLLLQLILLLFR